MALPDCGLWHVIQRRQKRPELTTAAPKLTEKLTMMQSNNHRHGGWICQRGFVLLALAGQIPILQSDVMRRCLF
jgi:hypothetical protein